MNYLDKLKHLNQRPDTGSTIQAGDRITWTRGDLTVQHGTVDFLHTDPDGTAWAFCSVADSWVIVNTKFATMVEDGGQR